MNTLAKEVKKRDLTYDWIRLIATIYVVIGHSAYLEIETTFGGVSYALPDTLNDAYYSLVLTFFRRMTGIVYGFHMPLFFALSGAVLALRPIARFDEVCSSKIKRLLIPYFVYGWGFMFPLKYLGKFYNQDSIKQALKGFLSGADSGHLWFLTSLFWCILCFVIIKKVYSRIHIESDSALLLICWIISMTYTYIPFDVLGLKTGLSYIFWFALGFFFQNGNNSIKSWNLKTILMACSGTLILEILDIEYGILDPFFTILIGIFFTYLMARICNSLFSRVAETKIWNILIRNCFYIYLFHDPLEYIVLRLFFGRRNWLSSSIGCYMFTFSRIVIVILISIVMGEILHALKTYLSNKRQGV